MLNNSMTILPRETKERHILKTDTQQTDKCRRIRLVEKMTMKRQCIRKKTVQHIKIVTRMIRLYTRENPQWL